MVRRSIQLAAVAAILLTAGMAGYLVSSAFGREVLREELEQQLTRLVRSSVEIESARLLVSATRGLRIEGRVLSTFRDASGPQLSVSRAVARLDLASLALGKIRLQRLLIEGAQLRVERSAAGAWTPEPIGGMARSPSGDAPEDLEQRVRGLRAFEGAARFFLDRGLLASRLELRGGRISLVDHRVHPEAPPTTFEADGIDGTLVRSWMTGEVELTLRAYFVDASGARTSFEAEGKRNGDSTIHLSVAIRDFELEHLLPYLTGAFPEAQLTGKLTGVVSVDSPSPDHGLIEFDWLVDDLDLALRMQVDSIPIASPKVHLQSFIELHPGRLRLSSAELSSGPLEIKAAGRVDRPVRESSIASLSVSLEGARLPEVETLVASLPESDREALSALLRRLTSGEIVRIGGEGRARMAVWRRLLAGQLTKLPDTFALTASAEPVDLSSMEGSTSLPSRCPSRR